MRSLRYAAVPKLGTPKGSDRDPLDDPDICLRCEKRAIFRIPDYRNRTQVGFCRQHREEAVQLTSVQMHVREQRLHNWRQQKILLAKQKSKNLPHMGGDR